MFLNLHGIHEVMPEFKRSIVQLAGPEDKEETESDNEDHSFMHSVGLFGQTETVEALRERRKCCFL